MLCDLHLHSSFSRDSDTPMEVHCEKAVKLGFACLCFTEHIEGNPIDPGFGFYRRQAYFDEVDRLREKYAGRLKILSGAEFSEPHLYPKLLEECRSHPYDYIIGSVHFWIGDLFPGQLRERQIRVERSFCSYWKEVLLAVRQGGFDAVGHLDYPKRFHHQLLYEKDQMLEIFAAMRENGIILEINCGGLRRQYPETNPGPTLLQLYAENGGQYVALGSDAHKSALLGYGVDQGKDLARAFGLREVYVQDHRPVLVAD